jgi:multicomponent Na+:H+ antiporter subunit G
MQVTEILTTVFLFLGSVVSLTGSYGLLRMPDFYARLHTAGKTDSLGQLLIFIGLVFVTPDLLTQIKLVLVAAILMIAAPTATHAITKAAHLHHLRPWTKSDPGGEP